MPEYSGNPTGEGNPPGQYSPSYMKTMSSSDGHFVTDKSYRGSMHVGINESAKVVSNQPQETKKSTLESRANKQDPIPQA